MANIVGNIIETITGDVNGDITVTGNMSILNKNNDIIINGNATANNNLSTNSNISTINGNINATNILLKGSVDISGNIYGDMTGDISNNIINVIGNIYTGTNLSRIDDYIITGTLTAGAVNSSGNTNVGATLGVTGNLDVAGTSTLLGNTSILNTLEVTGNTQLTGNIINIGKSGSTVNILGNTNIIQTTNLQVTDSLITLNKNGALSTAGGSGIEIEENSIITGYIKVANDRNSYQVKIPSNSTVYTIVLADPSGNCKILSGLYIGNNNSFGLYLVNSNLLRIGYVAGISPTTQAFLEFDNVGNTGLYGNGTFYCNVNNIQLNGNTYLLDKPIYLRSDTNHYLRYSNDVDGPGIAGYLGGKLVVTYGSYTPLIWKSWGIDIKSEGRSGSHNTNPKGLYVTGDFNPASNGVEFRHSNATQGIGIGYQGIYACGSNSYQEIQIVTKGGAPIYMNGSVGIGNWPSYKLHVFGDLYAEGWLRCNEGVYSQTHGAHLYRNDEYYGTWKIWGNKINSWNGINFSDSKVNLMMGVDTTNRECGFHFNDIGWGFRIDNSRNAQCYGNFYVNGNVDSNYLYSRGNIGAVGDMTSNRVYTNYIKSYGNIDTDTDINCRNVYSSYLGSSGNASISGRIGIGTTNPTYRLHIYGGGQTYSGGGYYWGNGNSNWVNDNWGWLYSIYSPDSIMTNGAYVVQSDSRIKKNIIDINDENALYILRKIEPKTYEYIDTYKKGNNTVIGFIAQEIKEIIPNAVSIITDFIPNFYTLCDINQTDISNNIIITAPIDLSWNALHDASRNEYLDSNGNPSSDPSGNKFFKIRLFDISNNQIDLNVINIIDTKNILVDISGSKLIDNSGNIILQNKYFLYGQEVDDFHSLDKNAIFTVVTAAVQDIDKHQQEDANKILILENKNTDLTNRVTSLELQNTILNDQVNILNTKLNKLLEQLNIVI